MTRKIRLFKGRLLGMGIALLIIGVQITLGIENYQLQEDIMGNILTIIVFGILFFTQLISQLFENQLKTTNEEFISGSLIKIKLLSQTLNFSIGSFVLIIVALLILGTQFTQIIVNLQSGDSILLALLGSSAMISLILSQAISPNNELKKITQS